MQARRCSKIRGWTATVTAQPMQAEDFAIASDRGFSYAGTLPCVAAPYFAALLTGPIQDASGVIEADVRDDQGIDDVWAVIVPPSQCRDVR
ncbi:MAG: hypothetical protein R2851_21750 [Caldilineaceae bacterium]